MKNIQAGQKKVFYAVVLTQTKCDQKLIGYRENLLSMKIFADNNHQ